MGEGGEKTKKRGAREVKRMLCGYAASLDARLPTKSRSEGDQDRTGKREKLEKTWRDVTHSNREGK